MRSACSASFVKTKNSPLFNNVLPTSLLKKDARELDLIVSRALCKVGVRKRFQNATDIVFNVIVFGVPFSSF